MVIMVLSALSKTTKVQAQVADIGAVEEVSGNAQIEEIKVMKLLQTLVFNLMIRLKQSKAEWVFVLLTIPL